MANPFFGWVVWNKTRNTVVFTDDFAFVWDQRDAAEEKCREGMGDEPRQVRVEFLSEHP